MSTSVGNVSPLDYQWTTKNPTETSQEDIGETAEQFESLLLGMLLRSMREAASDQGWLGCEGQSAVSSIAELAEQQVAQALSAGGGMGLARLIRQGLEKGKAARPAPQQARVNHGS